MHFLSDSAPLPESSSAIRAAVRSRICEMDSAAIGRESRAICESIERTAQFKNAGAVYVYLAQNNEASCERLIKAAFAAGKRVAAPVCRGGGRMNFWFFEADDPLSTGMFSIKEPPQRVMAVPAGGDIMIVPGLAFGADGSRIGKGGGYYDRYLAGISQGVFTVGAALSCQMAEALPQKDTDIGLFAVAGPGKIYYSRG